MGDAYRSAVELLVCNEGALDAILGHGRFGQSVEVGLAGVPDVQVRWCSPPPMSRGTRAAVRAVPPLYSWSLDLQPTRWHVAQSLRLRRAIARALATAPADVLLAHTHSSGLALGRRAHTIPVILSVDSAIWPVQSMEYWQPVRPWTKAMLGPSRLLERRALERATKVLAWTEWAAAGAREVAPRAEVEVWHPGLDLERFHPGPRQDGDRLRVLFVGARFSGKGGDDLLAALGERLGRDVVLDVVTQEPVAPRDGVRPHRLGPDDPELRDLLRRADVFCLPSRADAAPFAVLEAMASATPVVSTRVGGIPDLVGPAGVLVPPRDPTSLRTALDGLLTDDARRTTLGAAARARVEERYDARVNGARLASIMRSAIRR